jgi:hypothetical protein
MARPQFLQQSVWVSIRTRIASGWPMRSATTCRICAHSSAKRNSRPSRHAISTSTPRSSRRSAGSAIASRTKLQRSHPEQPWIAELARWEWALAASFDAKDAATVGIESLAAVAPGDWGDLRLEFHPSVQLLELSSNAQALCKAFADEQAPPEPALLDSPQPWLLWRQDLKTQYRSLEPDEAAAFDVVRNGGTFADMCEALCEWHDVNRCR